MPEALGLGWFAANQERPYPLSDAATREDDDGNVLPPDLVADLALWYPRSLGEFAFLGGVFCGPRLTSLVVLVAPAQDSAPAEFTPVASVSVAAARPHRVYRLSPLADGVAGTVAFGTGVRDDNEDPDGVSYKFSSPAQSLLAAKAARPYDPPGVTSLRRRGGRAGLSGRVRLSGQGDVEVVGREVTVGGRTLTAAVVQLRETAAGQVDLLSLYAGACGRRPESGTCPLPGVEYVNTVGPDCDGNLILTFLGGVTVAPLADNGAGLVLDYTVGLSEACTVKDRLPAADGRLPNEFDDQCETPLDLPPFTDDDDLGEAPPGSSEVVVCSELPYTDPFDDFYDGLPFHFWLNEGVASRVSVLDKPTPYPSGPVSAGPGGVLRVDSASAAADVVVCLWDDCAVYLPFDPEGSQWGMCRKVEACLRWDAGEHTVAGIALTGSVDYLTYGKASVGNQLIHSVVVDTRFNFVRLYREAGNPSSPTILDTREVPEIADHAGEFVCLAVELARLPDGTASVYFELKDADGVLIASDSFTPVYNLQPGPFGLTVRPVSGNTEFAWFRVTDAVTGPVIGC